MSSLAIYLPCVQVSLSPKLPPSLGAQAVMLAPAAAIGRGVCEPVPWDLPALQVSQPLARDTMSTQVSHPGSATWCTACFPATHPCPCTIAPSGPGTAGVQPPLGTCQPSSKDVAHGPGAHRKARLWEQLAPK